MAQFSVNTQRFDPYKNFKFRVRWDGKFVAGISKVGALKRSTEVVEHREGGDPSTSRKSPGRTKFEAIMLERGVTHDTEFVRWANKVWNFGCGTGSGSVAQRFSQRHHIWNFTTTPASSRSPTKYIAAGYRSFKRFPISTPTPTPWRSNRSSWKTKAGNKTTKSLSRANRPLQNRNVNVKVQGFKACPDLVERVQGWSEGSVGAAQLFSVCS